MLHLRSRSSYALALVLALGACNAATYGMPLSATSDIDAGHALDAATGLDGGGSQPPPFDGAHHADAAVPGTDAALRDAGGTSDAGSTGGGGPGAGIVACFTEGFPDTTCALPTHCCFNPYSSQHDGECAATACSWGTINCDGPEDCAGGQHCCAHALVDSDGITGYRLACQTAACGAAPANQELCHTTTSAAGTCSTPGSRCVPAAGNDSDLPPSLHICQ
jgi:hypothetical protein